MNDSELTVEVVDVTKRYAHGRREVEALRGLSLRLERGEFLSIMGASGSGKSTLLNLLVGLDRPTSGEIYFEGRALSETDDDGLTDLRRTRIGVVFQLFNLLPSITALENVALPLRAAGVRRREMMQRAGAALEQVGLVARADHRPDQLSGGEMQRVAIARALAIDPGLLVADEPTGSLDSESSLEILDLLLRLHREREMSVLMVTHSPATAAYADRIVTMRDGAVVDEVRPERSRAAAGRHMSLV